ncbi:peptidase C39 family protein [Nisaea sp.]|uniref:peptidase C39 family protein n=1 Tax=Nisaea sp. TaxID=2024842 RepID=UPI003B519777
MTAPSSEVRIRAAALADIDALTEIEVACFDSDRLSRRSFREFVRHGHSALLVAETDDGLAGYILILFRRGTALARLYSIAVLPAARGCGAAAALLEAGEDVARNHDCLSMRLEVRPDNTPAIALYERLGYREFGKYLGYYEDHSDALRYEKRLVRPSLSASTPSYYFQTSDFTCGPSCMMMALKAFDPDYAFSRVEEFRLWRESTTVFMQSGHGGCEPVGMAVALARHGLAVEVHVSQEPPLFLDSVRQKDRREALTLIQEDYRRTAKDMEIPIQITPLDNAGLSAALADGAFAIVLVSLYQMVGSRTPHWVLVYGEENGRFLIHDPWVETDALETESAAAALPVPKEAFGRMARWGRGRLRAAITVRKDRTQ